MMFDKTITSVRPYWFAARLSLIALFAVSAEAALPTVGPQASITCPAEAVNISLVEDIPTVVDSYPEGTAFCVEAGIHSPASPINLKANDKLVGQYGAIIDGTHVTMTWDIGSTSIIRGWNCSTDCSDVTVQNLVIRNLAAHQCIGVNSGDSTAPSNNWTIDHNEIYGCKTGVDVSNQSGATVTNNYIHHNIGDPSNPIPSERGGGYGAFRPSNTTFSHNEIAYNGPEQKITLSINVTFRNNYVHHNNSSGIWYDGENVNSVIEGNLSEDNPGQGIFYEASGQGIIKNNTLRRSDTGIFISISQNTETYGNVLEDNYRGIEYFVDCSSVGGGGENTAANGGAGVIYDLLNNDTHDNLVKLGTRSGSLANTLFLINCTSTESDSYSYGSNLIFQHNSYYVPSLTAQLWYWGNVSKFWSEWQGLGHDTTGSVQPASEYAEPVITSTGSATGTVGVAFGYQITATNSPTSFDATGLPAGLSISTGTGLISGTPTTAATSNVTLSAINPIGTGTVALTLTINESAPVVTSASTATGTVGVAFSYQITATNSPTSFNATGLPAGLSVSTGTGLISGTPTTSATSSVTLSATNAGGTGTRALTLTINPVQAPVITSPSTATGTAGVGFSYQITATNSPTSFNASRLPAGLSVNRNTGLVSGTPTNVGTTSNIIVRATNAIGSGTKGLTLTVNAGLPPAPVITSASTAVGTVGVAFSYQITATNSPTSYNASGLPAGLSVNTGTGLVSGTPTTAASSNVNLSAVNAGGTGTAILSLTINAPAPPITLVQKASSIAGGTSSATALSATFPAAVSEGRLIVASVSSWPNAPTGVTDSQGNAYTPATAPKRTSAPGGGSYTATYYARAKAQGVNTVTVGTGGSNGRISMVIAEFSGVNTMVAADSAISAAGKNQTPSSGNLTPSVAGDLLIGAGTHDATTLTTPGSGFTMVAIATEDKSTYQPLAMEYRILAGTTAAAATFSLGASTTWAQTGVLFKR